jgi:hypothetical protein
MTRLHGLVNGNNDQELRAFPAPQVINGLIIHFLVSKEFFVNAHKEKLNRSSVKTE